MIEIIQDVAELVSLSWTPPTMIMSALVIWLWGKEAWVAFRKKQKTPHDWLILGVTIGFIGQFVDNGYWGAAWQESFLEHAAKEWLFEFGVFSNVPARQFCGFVAAYCHARGAYQVRQEEHKANKWAAWSFAAGAAYVAFLVYVK